MYHVPGSIELDPKKKYEPDLNRSSSVLSGISSGSLAVIARNALDPWICAPTFQLVCLYQIEVLSIIQIKII